jgi:MFS family permease
MSTVSDDLVVDIPRSRIAVASMVGTTVEFYDFYVYATAAVSVFPQLFFPRSSPTTALLASLATFGLAFVARPVGSMLFGHFGDRVGRKATLVASLLVMGIATFAIGLLPTYPQVGLLAPALLAVMRFAQGLALGGEWSGAALLAIETARPTRRGWMAMWPQLGAPLGFLLANVVFLILISWLGQDSTQPDLSGGFYTWGWRIPFLLSAVMVAIGLYVRLRLTETPVFTRAVQRGEPVNAPLLLLFRANWPQVFMGTFVIVAAFSLFYIITTWVLSYGTAARPPKGTGLGYGYVDFLQLQLIAVLFFAATIPLAGLLIDRFGRRRTSAGARTPLRGCEFGVPAVAAAGGGGAVQPFRHNGFPAGGVPHPDAAAVDEQPATPIRVAADVPARRRPGDSPWTVGVRLPALFADVRRGKRIV